MCVGDPRDEEPLCAASSPATDPDRLAYAKEGELVPRAVLGLGGAFPGLAARSRRNPTLPRAVGLTLRASERHVLPPAELSFVPGAGLDVPRRSSRAAAEGGGGPGV